MSWLKAENFPCLVSEDKPERFKAQEGTDVPLLAWRRKRRHGKEWGQLLTASKEMETSVLHPQGAKICQQQERAWKEIFAQSHQMSTHPRGHLDFSLIIAQRMKPENVLDFWPTQLQANKQVLLETVNLLQSIRNIYTLLTKVSPCGIRDPRGSFPKFQAQFPWC